MNKDEKKVLIVNRDWTLIKPKSGKFSAQDQKDWEFLPNVFDKLQVLLTEGYHIAVSMNQTGIASGYCTLELHEAVNREFVSRCGAQYADQFSFYIADSADSPFLKPGPGVYNDLSAKMSIDTFNSQVVGNTKTDSLTASEIKLPFVHAEQFFNWAPSVTVFCGFPGSGLTTHSHEYHPCDIRACLDDIVRSINPQYHIEWKNIYYDVEEKIICDGLQMGASVVVDRTNLSRKRRKRFIDIVQQFKAQRKSQTNRPEEIKIACKFFDLPLDICKERYKANHVRTERDLWEMEEFFDRMEGEFEPPDISEGFDDVITLDESVLMQ